MSQSIIEILDAVSKQQLPAEAASQSLKRYQQKFEKTLQALPQQKVAAADQETWVNTLFPGLEAAYAGLIGAAAEGLAYLDNQAQDSLEAAMALALQADEIMTLLSGHLGLLSLPTQQMMQQALNPQQDQLEVAGVSTGRAESTVSFLDE